MTYQLALLPGDGIGVEVTAAAEQVLAALTQKFDLPLKWQTLPWPSTAWHQQHGTMMPDDAMQQLQQFDALLLGALGDPGPTSDHDRYRLPDGISLAPLLQMRKGLDLWACERPARLLPGAPCYLADPRAREVDMLVIRENSEGEYVNQGGRLRPGSDDEIATQLEVFSRKATKRLIRHAFQRARERMEQRQKQAEEKSFPCDRGGNHAAQVCLITKRNAQPAWGEMYTEVFAELAEENPDIATHHELVDAACMKFVQSPWQFDVVVASNLHGDILTDLAAVLSGGLGFAPSCNINPEQDGLPALFEPTHGSAPDIAGQGIANPSAMLLTTVMLLRSLGLHQAAIALEHAVTEQIKTAPETTGAAVTQAIIERL
ncbi:isocitrate/isopropylmalate dehydrogenase family protein [Pontibacter sp. JAM-7]|uniref:isocitrate/isopropylmalate dehydrogenase family protein n=1 Tax=Pontibacter sp. JAM-7 TaxID=3366581 RepID=UPI003AF55CDF